jgi:hypothetical protein
MTKATIIDLRNRNLTAAEQQWLRALNAGDWERSYAVAGKLHHLLIDDWSATEWAALRTAVLNANVIREHWNVLEAPGADCDQRWGDLVFDLTIDLGPGVSLPMLLALIRSPAFVKYVQDWVACYYSEDYS